MRKFVPILVVSLLALAVPVQLVALPLSQETIVSNYHFTPDDHTYMYASIVDFYQVEPDLWSDGVWVGTAPGMESTLDWTHTLPDGLRVPPDIVTRAKMKIDGEYIDEMGNTISIQGTLDWDPLEHMWFDNSIYNLTNVQETGFWNMGGLDISIWASEYDLRIDEAVLMMDYTSAVPEPASLLLIGLGLLGGMTYRKLRRS